MIKPFNGNSIAEIKSEEYDFVIVGRETDGVELNDAVDFAKEWSDVLVLARKHPRISNLDRRSQLGSGSRDLRLTQKLHDALLKSNLIVS